MAESSFSEDLGKEMAGRAILWGPAIAGGFVLGPLGIAVGLVASVAMLASGKDGGSSPPNAERPAE